MNHRHAVMAKRLVLAAVLSLIGTTQVCAAESPTFQFPTTNVTATRYKTPSSQLGNSVRVLDSKTWSKAGVQTLHGALSLIPGVSVAESGGLPGIFMRGLPAQNVKVMFDGISLFDPTSTQGTWNFGGTSLDSLDRIEVVEGSQSVLYGANAMMGVIQLIPKSEGSYLDIRGGDKTDSEALGFSKMIGGTDVHLNFSHTRDGSKSSVDGGDELDATNIYNYHVSLKRDFGFGIGKVTLHKNRSIFELDETYATDLPVSSLDTHGYVQTQEQDLSKFTWIFPQSENSTTQVSYQRNYVSRTNEGSIKSYVNTTSRGFSDEVESLYTLKPMRDLTLLSGLNYYKETAPASIPSIQTRFAYFSQLGWNLGRVNIQTGFRQEVTDVATDKTADSYSLGLSFPIPEFNLTLRGSLGRGFRNPTLFEKTFAATNELNSPEISFSKDTTLEYDVIKNIKLSTTIFESILENEIYYSSTGPNAYKYLNLSGIRRTTGITYGVGLTNFLGLDFLSITYLNQHAIQTTAGQIPLRVPENQLSLAAGTHLDRFELGASLTKVGERTDIIFDSFDTPSYATLSPYLVISSKLTYHVDAQTEMYTSVQNLLNSHYQEATGYAQPDRQVQVGMKWTID